MRVEDLTAKGYDVVPAMFEDDDRPTVYFVSGRDVRSYVTEDDVEAIASLADARPQELQEAALEELVPIAVALDVPEAEALQKDDLVAAILVAELDLPEGVPVDP